MKCGFVTTELTFVARRLIHRNRREVNLGVRMTPTSRSHRTFLDILLIHLLLVQQKSILLPKNLDILREWLNLDLRFHEFWLEFFSDRWDDSFIFAQEILGFRCDFADISLLDFSVMFWVLTSWDWWDALLMSWGRTRSLPVDPRRPWTEDA